MLKDWQSLRGDAFRSDKINQMLSQLREEVARIAQRSQSDLGMFPFRIYNFPSPMRRYQNTNDWRRIKVRGGFATPCGASTFSTTYPAIGSDMGASQFGITCGGPFGNTFLDQQVPPNSSALTVSDGVSSSWNEFLIANDDTTYAVWFSFVLPNSVNPGGFTNNYHYGLAACKRSDPTQAVILNTGEVFDCTNSWPTAFDINDLYNYKVGEVFVNNTAFSNVPKGLSISQFQFGNISLPGSPYGTNSGGSLSSREKIAMNFRGLYDDTILYYVGDVVTIIYADSTTVNSARQFIYDPDDTSIYNPKTLLSPMSTVSPQTNSPDPWKQLSKSPVDADYHNGAYDASKYYLRTA